MRTIRPKNINKPFRETIYAMLVEDIILGRINPGEKLLESELAERFQVSRTPIREALLQLEKEGYVTHKKNVGAVVKRISHQTVQEIFAVIGLLEAYATELVASAGLHQKDLETLDDLQRTMSKALTDRNYPLYVEINMAFHRFFVEKCGNATLRGLVSDLRNRVYKFMAQGLTVSMHAEEYMLYHQRIVDAIKNHNPDSAGEQMRTHVRKIKLYLGDALKKL